MKITLKLDKIEYGKSAENLLPKLKDKIKADKTLISKLASVALSLPPELVCTVLDAVPEKEKNDITYQLFTENKAKIIKVINDFTKAKFSGFYLYDISLSENMEVTLNVGYDSIANLIKSHLAGTPDDYKASVWRMPILLAGKMMGGAISVISQDKMEDTIIHLIDKNQTFIISKLEKLAKEKGIIVKLKKISAIK